MKTKPKFTSIEWTNVSQSARDFIKLCLTKDQLKRPSIEQLLDHQWICEVDDRSQASDTQQVCIQNNLIRYMECSSFQKLVMSLISGLNTTEEELEILQKEFLRLDENKDGTLDIGELKKMTSSK